MKPIILSLAIAVTILAAYKSSSNKSAEDPLPSYKIMHKNAQLDTSEKRLIYSWV
jgi:hypothetical protein